MSMFPELNFSELLAMKTWAEEQEKYWEIILKEEKQRGEKQSEIKNSERVLFGYYNLAEHLSDEMANRADKYYARVNSKSQ